MFVIRPYPPLDWPTYLPLSLFTSAPPAQSAVGEDGSDDGAHANGKGVVDEESVALPGPDELTLPPPARSVYADVLGAAKIICSCE